MMVKNLLEDSKKNLKIIKYAIAPPTMHKNQQLETVIFFQLIVRSNLSWRLDCQPEGTVHMLVHWSPQHCYAVDIFTHFTDEVTEAQRHYLSLKNVNTANGRKRTKL